MVGKGVLSIDLLKLQDPETVMKNKRDDGLPILK